MDIRSAILQEKKRQGISTYELAKRCNGLVPYRTIYHFLTSRRDRDGYRQTSGIRIDALGHILDALGLRLIPKDDEKQA